MTKHHHVCQLANGTKSMFNLSFNTSRDGDSLGSPFQYLVPISVKNFFLMSNLSLLWHNFRLFPLVQALVTWEKRLTPLLPPNYFQSQEAWMWGLNSPLVWDLKTMPFLSPLLSCFLSYGEVFVAFFLNNWRKILSLL